MVESQPISRREALSQLGQWGLGIFALPIYLKYQTAKKIVKSRYAVPDGQVNNSPPPENALAGKLDAYKQTILERLSVYALEIGTNKMVRKVGLNPGNAAITRDIVYTILDRPLPFILEIVGKAPLKEEALYRLWPSVLTDYITRLLSETNNIHWDVGLPVSIIFAAMHNFVRDKNGQLHFNSKKIPISQGISGLYYWWLMRTRGFDHVLIAHSLTNSISLSTIFLSRKINGKEAFEKIINKSIHE